MKILILGAPRTGTTYLYQLINMHTYAHSDPMFNCSVMGMGMPLSPSGEFFNPHHIQLQATRMGVEFDQVLDIRKSIICNMDNVVIKHHTWFNQYKKIAEYCNHPNWYKIGIIKRNIARTALSHYISMEYNQYRPDDYETRNIFIDTTRYNKVLQAEHQAQQYIEQTNECNEKVYFEDLKFDWDSDYDALEISKQVKNPPFQHFQGESKNPWSRQHILNIEEVEKVASDYLGYSVQL